jgi:SAM-dependent methyltransferase
VRVGEFLLDIGSGYGRVLDYLRRRGFNQVMGLEPNLEFLYKSKFAFVCGKGEHAPFKNESFGAIFLIGVLSYILEDSRRIQIVSEIHRTLKPQGLLFMSSFLISSDDYHQQKYGEGQKEHGKYGIFESDSGGTFRHSEEEDLRSLLDNFHILNWKQRPFITMNKREALGLVIEAKKP